MTADTPTVLIVEDSETVADTYAAFLAEDYHVRTAYGGDAGLAMFDETVNVVLLDRRMPGTSGDEVLDSIAESPHDARVVMLTAVDPEFDIVELPFDAYVIKPVERAELRAIVADIVERSGYDEDLRHFLALASKRATLELEKTEAELAHSDQYDRINRRLRHLRASLGADAEELQAALAGRTPALDAADVLEESGGDGDAFDEK